jgi:hypothetical protein
MFLQSSVHIGVGDRNYDISLYENWKNIPTKALIFIIEKWNKNRLAMGQPWVLSEKTDVAEVQAQLILRS